MIKLNKVLTLFSFLLLFLYYNGYSWGFFCHKKIIELTTFNIPQQLFPLYKKNFEQLKKYSVQPDKRRYSDKKEAPYHFFDTEHFIKKGFDANNIPFKYSEALNTFGEKFLNENGKVFWRIQEIYNYLIKAFKEKNNSKIIKFSAELSHYISDAIVPLHNTSNYNGQLTNQNGIHSLWETKVPKMYFDDYNLFVKLKPIKKPFLYLRKEMNDSFNESKNVLKKESELTNKLGIERKFRIGKNGNVNTKNYSKQFIKEYGILMNKLIQKKLLNSINLTTTLIVSAWKKAGKPKIYINKIDKKKYRIRKNKKIKKNEIKGHTN